MSQEEQSIEHSARFKELTLAKVELDKTISLLIASFEEKYDTKVIIKTILAESLSKY